MKKFTLLFSFFILAFASSCSSDDDGGSNSDPFIGEWKFYKYFVDDVEVQLEACEYESTIIITSNGTFTTTQYEDDLNGGCELEYVVSGTWENEGNGFYTTVSEGDSYTQEVHFEGNTMYTEEVDEGVVYKSVFIKE